MKKITLLLLSLFLIAGCSNENGTEVTAGVGEDTYTTETDTVSDLKSPEIEWCQLYNPNGFDTVTCVITNPNNVDIDVSYDLVFYKDDKEVSRIEYMSVESMSKDHDDVIWVNADVPSSKDADDVKMENIVVTKATTPSVKSDINYIETTDNKAYFSVKGDDTPTLNTIYVFEYNDDNKNKKCDKGELVVVNIQSVMEKDTKISVNAGLYEHDSYEVHYNAY